MRQTKQMVEGLLWCSALLAGALGAIRWHDAGRGEVNDGARGFTPVLALMRAPDSAIHDAATQLDTDDPFRTAHRPADIPYRGDASGAPAPPPPPLPVLIVEGIVGGPPWRAVLEGIPGHQSPTVVEAGQVIAQLRIRRITRDSVVVSSADTTWRLAVRRAW